MTLLLDEPELSYETVGRRLGLPVGSIGPTQGALALAPAPRRRSCRR